MFKHIMLLTAFTCILAGCGAPNYMVRKDPCPDIRTITAPADKSVLVIGRTTSFGGIQEFKNYLDRKFIGNTHGHTTFATTVDPGDHFVSAQGENVASLLIRFESGKTYYVQNEVRMGVITARINLVLVDAEHLYKDMDGKCYFFEVDKSELPPDLTEEEFEKVKQVGGITPINVTTVSIQK